MSVDVFRCFLASLIKCTVCFERLRRVMLCGIWIDNKSEFLNICFLIMQVGGLDLINLG